MAKKKKSLSSRVGKGLSSLMGSMGKDFKKSPLSKAARGSKVKF